MPEDPIYLYYYHNLYLKTDALLLADVFEKFLNTYLDYYGLEPCHYFSSLRLSWYAMLKMTGIELGPISDIDMHLFMKKGLTGGISYIPKDIVKQRINAYSVMMIKKPNKYITS